MRELEKRIKVIEEMVAAIYAATVLGSQAPQPGEAEYKRAVEAMTDGDMVPLRAYLRNGGVVPAESVFPEIPTRSCSRQKSGGALSVNRNP